ncbi:phospholipase DDHD2-like isoform X3 [Biomphalaria glabrata]|uniref:Phospholipase DDHD2-like isoform X3 n=1 Tax=Biomphalaria glabrata TaxID=6526 RepID=A0A9W2YBU8_BIOGL|nr:phospholipase DDHD2-like isoform X3 [Biomphalaria glabrata]KAI8789570.1 SEC23-interacting protein isoform X3 [Biomphalaria glabrata]
MSDRSKKESTPPPLLLMPAGGGLTLVPPDNPNIFMPVIQSAPSILDPDEEAEADSFVGQSAPSLSPGRPVTQPASSHYFQSSQNVVQDPFAQIGHGHPPPAPMTTASIAHTVGESMAPPPHHPSPAMSFASPPSAAPPPKDTSGSGNIYRHQGGRPQYAQMPSSFSSMPSPVSQPPIVNLPPVKPINQLTNNISQAQYSPSPGPLQNHASQVGGAEPTGQYTGGLYYQPVRYHWCYQQNENEIEIWRPFSVHDSTQLEIAFQTRLAESPNHTTVNTNGGRNEVNVGLRIRKPVYWQDFPVPVRRCSWFYKREGDNRYIPYEEELSLKLENEYKKAMETNGWHRRLEFPDNVIIVMHNANVIVQFPPSSTFDEWGNVQNFYTLTGGDQMRPRVVKRGVEDFATIEYGEREEVDHLVFFVPGIEDMTNKNGKSVEALVDNFRSNALSLLQSHFTNAYQSKSVNRVEFLPIIWSEALEDGVSGLKEQVTSVTLPSTSKLRHFINNNLIDTLFYTSPLYCQKICETVGREMNRMFHVFLEKNQSFSGDVSVAGHSLGSVILFDILLNQRLPGDIVPASNVLDNSLNESSTSAALEDTFEAVHGLSETESENSEALTLETLLSKVGLQDKLSLFQNEQMDVESLIMCTEQDLKDIGLPLGPRKKLLGHLKEEQDKKDASIKEKMEQKKKEENEKAERQRQAAEQIAYEKSDQSQKNVSAHYLRGALGAGQLKVSYPQLDFTPSALFALGSPIGVYLTLRGVQDLGEFFQLPTCSRVYNIFHPFDPMAYRMEPLIRSNTAALKPVLIPHYKGRKRLHLEFKEAVTRYGTDIKQKIIDSVKSTWNTLNDFARAHRSDASKSSTMETEVQSEINQMMSHIAQQQAEDDRGSVSSMAEEEIHMGQLNEGHRVDYILQEGPLESFNDYLFALASHSCYWESEDTALLLLSEIYSPLGIRPVMPGTDNKKISKEASLPRQLPPPSSGMGTISSAAAYQTNTASYQSSSNIPQAAVSFQSPQSYGAPPVGAPPPMFISQGPPLSGSIGMRKSPYVAPDFNNLPSSQSSGPVLPPMGPAIAGGYRRSQP